MAHIAVVESNRFGLRLLEAAKVGGHEVSFLYSKKRAFFTDTSENRELIKLSDRVITLEDSTDPDHLRSFLKELHSRSPIATVICVEEYAVQAATKAAAALSIPATSAGAVALARNKFALRQKIASAGIPCGRAVLVRDRSTLRSAMSEVGYPVVIKPNRSSESLMAYVVRGSEDTADVLTSLEAEWARLGDVRREQVSEEFVCETYFEGPLVSADIIKSSAGTFPLAVSERMQPTNDPTIELGTILPPSFGDDARLACSEYAAAIVETVGLDRGIFHVEMILTTEGPRLVELNPRLMGGSLPYLYDVLMDMSVHKLLIDVHLGLPIAPTRLPKNQCTFAIRLQSKEDGRIARLPELFELPLGGLKVLRREILANANEDVKDETILGRLYLQMYESHAIWEKIDRLLDAYEDAFEVALMRPKHLRRVDQRTDNFGSSLNVDS